MRDRSGFIETFKIRIGYYNVDTDLFVKFNEGSGTGYSEK